MPAASDILNKRKIAVLGSRSVGKSSLVLQFIENTFIEPYHPTIESTFVKTIRYHNQDYDCEIIDTAGQDEYSLLNSKHAIGIHGYVLVYSVTSRNSFDMIQIIYDKIVNFSGVKEIPCVIVGSKADLEQFREVTKEEGEELARQNHAQWLETSAKNNVNVAKVFESCLAQVAGPNSKGDPPMSKCLIM
ncbi:small GTPase superfamily [Amylostereum chailletii]|nr:small GTPase superfamily [Amylostereum chailletii]